MTEPHDARTGVVGPAWEALSDSARGLTRLLGSAGTGAVAAAPSPVRSMGAKVLTSLDQLPSASREMEVLMAEVHAQRLGLQAMQAELDALDGQLEMLEKSLAPVMGLSHQLTRLRTSLHELVDDTQPEAGEPGAAPSDVPPPRRARPRASAAHHLKESQS